jgi:hypothetical protein
MHIEQPCHAEAPVEFTLGSTLHSRRASAHRTEPFSRLDGAVMNKEALKKCLWHRVQLMPVPHRFDDQGSLLTPIDDDWIIGAILDDGVRISNPRTGFVYTLGFDHIYSYTSNPGRTHGGLTFAFLMLKIQMPLTPGGIRIRPNSRPGESVPPNLGLSPQNRVRLSLFRQLRDSPGKPVHYNELPDFAPPDVLSEIVRSHDEGMVDARVLSDGCRIVAAVALRMTPRGFDSSHCARCETGHDAACHCRARLMRTSKTIAGLIGPTLNSSRQTPGLTWISGYRLLKFLAKEY